MRRSLTLIRAHLEFEVLPTNLICGPLSSQFGVLRSGAVSASEPAAEPKWIQLGHPSYVWRFGQDRRLALVQQWVPLDGKAILDVGCGIGTYVRKFRQFSDDVHGVDIDDERVAKARESLPNIDVAPGEQLPYPDGRFDVVFLHEVIEHVDDDRATIREAVRVLREGGRVVIYAPNRLYPFETHGIYFGKRYLFGNIPMIGYLPNPLRNVFAPHVRAYTHAGIERLFDGLPTRLVVHAYVYPGFDNLIARHRALGFLLRRLFYPAERTPLRRLGLSHFLVAQKLDGSER
jgi:ubiquinone/menaquinone biosynthesis C-methylase UbiE